MFNIKIFQKCQVYLQHTITPQCSYSDKIHMKVFLHHCMMAMCYTYEDSLPLQVFNARKPKVLLKEQEEKT